MLNIRPEYILIAVLMAIQIVVVYFWWRYLAKQFKSTYRAYDTLVFTAIFTSSFAIVTYILGNKLDINADLLLWLAVWPLVVVMSLQFVIFNLEVEALDLILRPLPTFIAGYVMSLVLGAGVLISDLLDPIGKLALTSLPVALVVYLVINLAVAVSLQWKYPRLVIVTLVTQLLTGILIPIYAYGTSQLSIREMTYWAVVFLVIYFATAVPIIATNAQRKARQSTTRA